MVFGQKLKISNSAKKDTITEGISIGADASQEEQNGTNFSSAAPSSEEQWVHKEILSKRLTIIVHGFRPETENFDSGKKGYHPKEHLKRSRMAQISAPY